MRRINVGINGMTCASCSAAVERTLRGLEGMETAHVNLATETATLSFDENIIDLQTIKQAVKRIGFEISTEIDHEIRELQKQQEQKNLRHRLIVSAILSTMLMIISMGPMLGLKTPLDDRINAVLQLLLSTGTMIAGYFFFTKGFTALIKGEPNMDSLVAIGTAASYLYSLYGVVQLLSGTPEAFGHLYFEGVGTIITLVMLGRYLENSAKGKTGEAIRKLMELAPQTATILRNGERIVIDAKDVLVGDTVLVKPGEKLPVDGVVLFGSSAIDESLLTGESIPVEKTPGSDVYAATLNTTGVLHYRASKVGSDTALVSIIRLVRAAQGSKAPIARIADRISGVFVPIVIALSTLTLVGWMILGKVSFDLAIIRAVSVLVIACPCALGLATPIAIMVGSGKGAKMGILFRNATAIEQLQSVKTVIFDKTGTLTTGKPVVTEIIADDPKSILSLAASLEAGSEHPLSKAIVAKGADEQITIHEVTGFQALVGRGVEGTIDDTSILIGNLALMNEQGVPINEATLKELKRLSDEGKTPLLVARKKTLLGIIAVADTLREESIQVIANLKRRGIGTVMLTGDNERTARAIAVQAGIDSHLANQLPDQKEAAVTEYTSKKPTAMVGDGINDAPSLAAATVGIAVGSATDVALETADVVLVRNNLEDVERAIRLSDATMRNIRQNLFWAFIYNIIGIPVAMGLLAIFGGPSLNPMFAALAMSFSSVSVVGNALRLNRFK